MVDGEGCEDVGGEEVEVSGSFYGGEVNVFDDGDVECD